MGLFDSVFNRQMIRPPALWLPTHALGAKDDRLGGSLFEPSEKYGVVTFSVWVILSIPSVESNDMFPPAIAIL